MNKQMPDNIRRIAELAPPAKLPDGRPNTHLAPLTRLLEAEGAENIFPPCFVTGCPNLAVYLLPCSDTAVCGEVCAGRVMDYDGFLFPSRYPDTRESVFYTYEMEDYS